MYLRLNIIFFITFQALNSEVVKILPFFDTLAILHFVKKYLPEDPIILEAGAFDGEDSLKMIKIWPKCIVHAFEPVPLIYKWLSQKTKDFKNIYRYMYALSDRNGTAKFHLSEDPSKPNVPTTSGSLLPAKEHLNYHFYTFNKSIQVKTITLDDWAKKNNITKIDFLWLDMQGYELFALKKGLNVLKNVKVICTELEFIEAYKGQPLFDEMKNWIENQGFKLVAKDAENFTQRTWCCNAVFVKS